MFNIGSKDKDKLKENMEEIKEMIGGEQNQAPNNQQPQSQDQFNQPNEKFETGATPNQEPTNTSGGGQPNLEETTSNLETPTETQQTVPETDLQDSNSTQDSFEQPTQDSFSNQGNKQSRANNLETQQPNQTVEKTGRTKQEYEEPTKETKKKPSAESKGETLFLEVNKFNKMQETLKQLRQLSSEIEGTMENLETGLEEDKKTEEDTQKILEDFKDRRDQIEEIMNPESEE